MSMTASRLIRLGTRGSDLARWQARYVAARLQALGHTTEEIVIRTTGDLDQQTAFSALGAKGIFVKQIEAALIEGRIDLAVHSLKDLPTELPEELELGAVLEREMPWDALVSERNVSFEALPRGATVATGSLRRAAQIRAMRPDLQIVPLRGNVPTRIAKIREGRASATLLALAGLKRLGLEAEASQVFDAQQVTPSMGQGSLGLEVRRGELSEALAQLEHGESRLAAEAERAFIRTLGGGCKTPAGVLAEPDGEGQWRLTGFVGAEDGSSLLRETRAGVSGGELNPVATAMARTFRKRADSKIMAALDSADEAASGTGES